MAAECHEARYSHKALSSPPLLFSWYLKLMNIPSDFLVYTMAPWDIRGGASSPMCRSAERKNSSPHTDQWVWQTELMSTVVGPFTLYLACTLSCSLMSDSVAPWTVCSLLGSFVRGIHQAWILEWVAISYSRGSSQLRDQTSVSCIDRRILLPLSHMGIPLCIFSLC